MILTTKLKPYGNENVSNVNSVLYKYIQYYPNVKYEVGNKEIIIQADDSDAIAVEFVNRIKDLLNKRAIINFNVETLKEEGALVNAKSKCAQKELPLTLNEDITLFHHHVLFRQIPLNDNLLSWYNSNFINIYYRTGVYCFFDYTDYKSYYEPLNLVTTYYFDESEKFNNREFFKSEIEDGKYIYIWIDNFYLNTAYCHRQKHDIHPVLVYGFNADNSTYMCACFEIKRGFFTCNVNMDEVHTAFESARLFGAPEISHPPVYIVKPKAYEIDKYNYSEARFLRELYDYMNGTGRLDNVYFVFGSSVRHNTKNDCFGINVTKVLIEHLIKTKSLIFDYRIFHMVVENKGMILRSLKYFCKDAGNSIQEYISVYDNIHQDYIKVRNLYIKRSMTENRGRGFYEPPKRKDTIEEMCEWLTTLVNEEYTVLKRLYPLLERYLIADTLDNVRVNLAKQAEISEGSDGKGFFYSLKWDHDIRTTRIRIFNRFDLFDGLLVFSDGTEKAIKGYEAENHVLDTTFSRKKVLEIRYYPDKYIGGDETPVINVYQSSPLYDSIISCSSVFSERTDLSFIPQNVLSEDENEFWCPEVNDKERYIQFDFDDITEFNTSLLKQHYATNRIAVYRIDCSMDGINWRTALRHEGLIYEREHMMRFDRVKGKSVRLVIEKCNIDITGYDVPNIIKFEIHNCSEAAIYAVE